MYSHTIRSADPLNSQNETMAAHTEAKCSMGTNMTQTGGSVNLAVTFVDEVVAALPVAVAVIAIQRILVGTMGTDSLSYLYMNCETVVAPLRTVVGSRKMAIKVQQIAVAVDA